MPIDVDALRHIPLFATLSREELGHVAAMTVERHYDRGDMILLEGDVGGALRYVRSGLVKVYKTSSAGKDQVLQRNMRIEFSGERLAPGSELFQERWSITCLRCGLNSEKQRKQRLVLLREHGENIATHQLAFLISTLLMP
jgi:hypothetical protein